jgi:hypothetical protein
MYFVGASAAFGLGPSMRFIAGTHNVARQLAGSVARRAKRSGADSVSSGSGDQVVHSSDDVFDETA